MELTVSIVTPESSVVGATADQVTAPSVQGEVGILANHKPLLASLQEGIVGVHAQDGTDFFTVSGGFLEVSDNRVTVLAETAEKASEIDVERAEAALKDASSKLDALAPGSSEYSEEQARIRRAKVRIMGAKLASH